MSIENIGKINHLLKEWPFGTVMLSSWLTERGYSYQLLARYVKSGWIERIGVGAYIRSGDDLKIEGAIYTLQRQSNSSIHIGGKSALSILGKAQYLEFMPPSTHLFGGGNEQLPAWLKEIKWVPEINYNSTTFLPNHLGLVEKEFYNFSMYISGVPRAFMEYLYGISDNQSLIECYEIMEGLTNLRPQLIQELLENCTSVKVKRLFLYMAKKAGHQWYDYLDENKINLGTGKRSLAGNGIYIPEYKISLPKKLVEYGKL